MRRAAWKWGLALGLSGVLHAGAAIFVLPDEDEIVQIAGGQGVEVALAGTAFADLSAAGEPSDMVEPLAQAATQAAPVEPESAVQPAEPVHLPATDAPVQEARIPPAEVPANAATEAENPIAEPLEPRTAEFGPGEAQPAELDPVQPQETVAALPDIPIPTPRPHYEPPKAAPRQTAPARGQASAPPPPAARAQRSGGSGGRDDQDARRGAAEGGREAAANRGNALRASASGNAALSNYPGKIASRLRRALRYPRAAQRQRLRGEVHVAFTVSRSGAVSGIRVVRSSGSPVLDQAAVETVHRAAPFPAIPDGAGRASWPFTVPLAFVR